LKFLGKSVFSYCFYLQCQCDLTMRDKTAENDLDLWPLTPKSIRVIYLSWPIIIPSLKFIGLSVLKLLTKINRGHLLVITNHHIKFEGPKPKGSLVIDRKTFLLTRSMWPWPLTPKSIGVIYFTWPIIIPCLTFLGLSVLKL
jgi:hypothetical protein